MFVLFDLKTYASNDRAHRHCSHVVTVVVNFIKRQARVTFFHLKTLFAWRHIIFFPNS